MRTKDKALEHEIEKTKPHRTLEERAAAYGNKLGPYHEFEWGEPVGKEKEYFENC